MSDKNEVKSVLRYCEANNFNTEVSVEPNAKAGKTEGVKGLKSKNQLLRDVKKLENYSSPVKSTDKMLSDKQLNNILGDKLKASSKKANKGGSKPKKKTSSSSKAKPKKEPAKEKDMGIRIDFETGIAYDIASGKALRDMYTDAEKKRYCDRTYGKGRWRKMTYDEVREKMKIDMELRKIAKSFDIDEDEDDYLED